MGMYQNKFPDLSRMLLVAVEVLYFVMAVKKKSYDFIYLSLKIAFKSNLISLNMLLGCSEFFCRELSFTIQKHLNPNKIIGYLSKFL